MSIKIIAIGKTSKSYLKEGIAEFEKRLQRYIKIKLIELTDSAKKNDNIAKIVKQQSEDILSRIRSDDHVIVLDERGISLTTIELAKYIETKMQHELVFCIGGVYGIGDAVKQRADLVLSFSEFTFTHQMIRLLLYEQLYRTLNYLGGGKYHK